MNRLAVPLPHIHSHGALGVLAWQGLVGVFRQQAHLRIRRDKQPAMPGHEA
jgi:hypothetical protein